MMAAILIGASIGIAQEKAAKTKKTATDNTKEVIYMSSQSATYTEKFPGVAMAVLWGDPDKGPHGTFTKFSAGFDAGIHTHTNDVWCLVIKGAYLYLDEAGDKRVAPGEFIRIPGGHKHWSGGDKAEGVLMYQEGSGKFDKINVKE